MQNNKMGVFFVHSKDCNEGSIVLAEGRDDARKFYAKQYLAKYFDVRCMKLFEAEFESEFAFDAPKFLKENLIVK